MSTVDHVKQMKTSEVIMCRVSESGGARRKTAFVDAFWDE